MLENAPKDFPFTVYLVDCPGDKIAQFTQEFTFSAVFVPALVCVVNTKDYTDKRAETLLSAIQAVVGVTAMIKHGLSKRKSYNVML